MIFCQNIWRVQCKNRRCHKISVPELTACGACLHPIVSICDIFRGKNRLSPPEDAVDERLSHGKTGSVHLRTPLMKGYPMEKPAQSTWGRHWWKAIPWKNRLSPPKDAVDERLSHGKTGDVLTVLWKNRWCPQFCKCDISGSSLEPFIYIYIYPANLNVDFQRAGDFLLTAFFFGAMLVDTVE